MIGAFLVVWIVGILTLVGGLFLTRMNWRPDVPPFGRHSRALDIAVHPEKYAKPEALLLIRTLNLMGAALLASGLVILLYELLSEFSKA